MEPFIVTIQLTKKDYLNLNLRLTYQNKFIITLTIAGVLLFVTSILRLLGIIQVNYIAPSSSLAISVIILLAPFMILNNARRVYKATQRVQHEIEYSFSNDHIIVKGYHFEGSFTWDNIIKTKEIANFLLLYSGKTTANILKKDCLTPAQMEFIKLKCPRK